MKYKSLEGVLHKTDFPWVEVCLSVIFVPVGDFALLFTNML